MTLAVRAFSLLFGLIINHLLMLKQYSQNPNKYSIIIITDLKIPDFNGTDLAKI